jgi:hypothetical protein
MKTKNRAARARGPKTGALIGTWGSYPRYPKNKSESFDSALPRIRRRALKNAKNFVDASVDLLLQGVARVGRNSR